MKKAVVKFSGSSSIIPYIVQGEDWVKVGIAEKQLRRRLEKHAEVLRNGTQEEVEIEMMDLAEFFNELSAKHHVEVLHCFPIDLGKGGK